MSADTDSSKPNMDFKDEYMQTAIPAAPVFKEGDRVAYRPNNRQLFYGTVIADASEPHRYVVRIDAGRVKCINAHDLTALSLARRHAEGVGS